MSKHKPTITVDGVTMDSKELAREAVDHGVPSHCALPLAEYLTGENKRPGHFLTAVLKNDLAGAVMRADRENKRSLHKYIQFLHMNAPCGSFGSEEKFNAWIRRPEPCPDCGSMDNPHLCRATFKRPGQQTK